MQLREVGMHVHDKRMALGITQAQLAKLAGLSRTTVIHLEKGSLDDLGFTKLNNLLSLLGMSFDATPRLKKSPALKMAAQTASTSYRKILTSDILKNILSTGDVPEDYKAHVMTLLDETPVPLVLSAIEETSRATNIPTKKILKNVSNLAKNLHTHRSIW
jgi:transcriptional regulator with XRE-family HTH domain